MKISVIIPVYNVSKYIERCLLSVLNQTWEDMEVILVDDCTPDDSIKIAERVILSSSRKGIVRVLKNQTNKGQSAARNVGIEAACGDYIYFLDSDDYLPLDSFSILMEYASLGEYNFVLGNYDITGNSRAIPFLKLKTGALLTNEKILSAYAHDLWPKTVWNMLVKRDFMLSQKLYFHEGIIHEDDLWTFQLACKAHVAFFVNKVTYHYYTHFHSTTGNPTLWNLECRVRVIELMYEYICAQPALQNNRYVYIIFEGTKAKYFDRILCLTRNNNFRRCSYVKFRSSVYLSYFKALFYFYPSIMIILRNIHYVLPLELGYIYLKYFVKLEYYWLILRIKLGHK